MQDVHKGYFARSADREGQEEAVQFHLERQGAVALSFDTGFALLSFSMWALQERRDTNIFTLLQLAPSDSSITKRYANWAWAALWR